MYFRYYALRFLLELSETRGPDFFWNILESQTPRSFWNIPGPEAKVPSGTLCLKQGVQEAKFGPFSTTQLAWLGFKAGLFRGGREAEEGTTEVSGSR